VGEGREVEAALCAPAADVTLDGDADGDIEPPHACRPRRGAARHRGTTRVRLLRSIRAAADDRAVGVGCDLLVASVWEGGPMLGWAMIRASAGVYAPSPFLSPRPCTRRLSVVQFLNKSQLGQIHIGGWRRCRKILHRPNRARAMPILKQTTVRAVEKIPPLARVDATDDGEKVDERHHTYRTKQEGCRGFRSCGECRRRLSHGRRAC
jgi:hypothetical protein